MDLYIDDSCFYSSNKKKQHHFTLDQGIVTKDMSCKPNIILGDSYSYYGLHEEYYVFGNRAHY